MLTQTQVARSPFSPPAAPDTDFGLRLLPLPLLVLRCQEESACFYRGSTYDPRFAHELFRRALEQRDDAAWAELFSLYRVLVESWVRRSGALAATQESAEHFVVAAFTRFWQAIPPERFSSFPSLSSLLQYLQRCSGCVVIDAARAQSHRQTVSEDAIPVSAIPTISPDTEALAQIEQEEFWRLISSLLHTEAERIVIHESFLMHLRPSEILERHQHTFADVNEIYVTKRNVLNRLSRNAELRQHLI